MELFEPPELNEEEKRAIHDWTHEMKATKEGTRITKNLQEETLVGPEVWVTYLKNIARAYSNKAEAMKVQLTAATSEVLLSGPEVPLKILGARLTRFMKARDLMRYLNRSIAFLFEDEEGVDILYN